MICDKQLTVISCKMENEYIPNGLKYLGYQLLKSFSYGASQNLLQVFAVDTGI